MQDNISPSVFISYAHEDSKFLESLRKNCYPLTQSYNLEWYDDREIRSGDLWKPHILQKLLSSDGIVLLISHHFSGSEFCIGVELPEAKRLADKGQAHLIPVLLEQVHLPSLQIDMYALLPKDDNNDLKPVKKWRDKQGAWVQVVDAIYNLCTVG